ncbi:MAG: hypothetical protein WD851_24235 [Pirellulales bacterium]
MHQITVEPTLSQELGGLVGQVLLCDANGRALGYFSPLKDKVQAADLQLEPPLSDAEIEELRKVRTGKPLEDILSRLGY